MLIKNGQPIKQPAKKIGCQRRTRRVGRNIKKSERGVVTLVHGPGRIMPGRLRTKLIFQRRINLSVTAGVPTGNQFMLNSLYDPDQTGVGNQPMGFDEFATLYQRYRVLGAKVILRTTAIYGPNAANTLEIGMAPSTETLALTMDPQQLGAQPGGVFKVAYAAGSNKDSIISRYYDIAKTIGISKLSYNADLNYGALTNANPANPLYLNVGVQTTDENSSSTVYSYVQINFYVEFSQPQSLAFS